VNSLVNNNPSVMLTERYLNFSNNFFGMQIESVLKAVITSLEREGIYTEFKKGNPRYGVSIDSTIETFVDDSIKVHAALIGQGSFLIRGSLGRSNELLYGIYDGKDGKKLETFVVEHNWHLPYS